MQFHTRSCFLFVLVATVVLALPAAHAAAADAPTTGPEVLVGSFEIQVQTQQRRVTVRERGGVHAAALPAIALEAEFVAWDPATGEVEVDLAVRNVGDVSLFAPMDARLVKLASPFSRLLNPDFDQGRRYGAETFRGSPALPVGIATLPLTWRFLSPQAQAFKADLEIVAGVPLAAGAGGTVAGEGGVKVTVPQGALPYEALVSIRAVDTGSVKAPVGDLLAVGAVELEVETAELGLLPPPAEPLQITIPNPSVGTDQFIVARQELVDVPEEGGLAPRLVPQDTATAVGDEIVSDADDGFDGVLAGGLYVFLANFGSGYVEGTVRDPGGPRPGAVVSNDTNTLVDVSDAAGAYRLYVNGGPFIVEAFDPLRGGGGSATGSIATSGATVTADITLAALANPAITRDGIRNSGFETGGLNSWQFSGAAQVVERLVATGATIEPTEGDWMADINTGTGAVGGVGSSLRQRFRVPAGVETLRLDFNFVSEEFPEFVGSIFDDAFRAVVTTPDGDQVFAAVSVNDSGGFSGVGDCGFPGGDRTCAQTGWREGSVDLSAYAGTDTPIEVTLLFSAIDAGDSIYDTHVLLDNIRFSSLWIDAKILAGAGANRARVEADVENANEVLSQAGILVRLRDVSTVADPGDLLDLEVADGDDFEVRDGENKLDPVAEELTLLGSDRSAMATDLNVYYVRSLNGPRIARAAQPDDYHDITYLGTSGLFMADGVSGLANALAHEAGHLLISPERAGDVLEHGAPAGNFMSTPPGTNLNREQSESVNDDPVPLLVD